MVTKSEYLKMDEEERMRIRLSSPIAPLEPASEEPAERSIEETTEEPSVAQTTLVTEIAKRAKITERQAKAALHAFQQVALKQLQSEGSVTIPGLGKISVVLQKPRVGRNPRTGEEVTMQPSKSVSFRPSGSIAEAVNQAKTAAHSQHTHRKRRL